MFAKHKIYDLYYQLIQNRKTKNYTCIQTSFHDVNTNNASSGLKENIILANLAPNVCFLSTDVDWICDF